LSISILGDTGGKRQTANCRASKEKTIHFDGYEKTENSKISTLKFLEIWYNSNQKKLPEKNRMISNHQNGVLI